MGHSFTLKKSCGSSRIWFSRTLKVALLLFSFELWVSASACAQLQIEGHEPISTTVTSPSRGFVIRGPVVGQNAHMSHWAERMRERIENKLNLTIPGLTKQPVVIQLAEISKNQYPSVSKTQKLVGPRIQQTLWIKGVERVDHEEMLEQFTSLMLQRIVWSHTRIRGEELKSTRVPDWFSVGVAQTLLPQLRSRNHDQVYRAWLSGEVLAAEDLVQYRFAADGRWMEKFSCGIFFEWLSDGRKSDELIERLIRTWALGEAVTVDVLSAFLELQLGGLEFEQNWDLWLAYMTRTKSGWQNKQEVAIQELAQLTLATSAGQSLSLDRLAEYAGELWLIKGLENLRNDIRTLAVGQSKEFLAVVSEYLAYLEMLEDMGSKEMKWFSHRPTPAEAREKYNQARAALSLYANVLGQRNQYLGEHHKRRAMLKGARPNGEDSPVNPAYKSYLDRFDTPTKGD